MIFNFPSKMWVRVRHQRIAGHILTARRGCRTLLRGQRYRPGRTTSSIARNKQRLVDYLYSAACRSARRADLHWLYEDERVAVKQFTWSSIAVCKHAELSDRYCPHQDVAISLGMFGGASDTQPDTSTKAMPIEKRLTNSSLLCFG
jgi:hypothetical protein